MHSPNGKASDAERRRSGRRSVMISQTGMDEDDFALVAMGISDGTRSSNEDTSSSEAATPLISNSQPAQTCTQQHQACDAPVAQAQSPRPSSIAKIGLNESFSLTNDGATSLVNGASFSRQSNMSGDDTPFIARVETPYQGPCGPSFPYQMYPQNVRSSRTASVATSLTAAPILERPYNGPIGPTHPYRMYPQNTSSNSDEMTTVTQAIPVGFPGSQAQYHRRIGPDGEDVGDLIGPDGHTEQLPPYTRYPEGTYLGKSREVEESVAVGVASVAQLPAEPTVPVQNDTASMQPQPQAPAAAAIVPAQIPGAGGLGLATRDPEFSTSTEDLGSSRSRYSAQSVRSQTSSQHINTAAAATAAAGAVEKEKPKPKWKQKAEKKLWGIIPYWAICLVFSSLIIMGVILGAVIGTLLIKHGRPNENDSTGVPVSVTVTFDAVPLATVPPDLRDLDEGDFSLPIINAVRSSKSCFIDQFDSPSWSCDIVFSELMISISELDDGDPTSRYAVNLSCNESLTLESNIISYGTQPPCFNEQHAMELVTDIYEPSRGPAWFFQMPYEKVVILPEDVFSEDDSQHIQSRDAPQGFGKRFDSFDGRGSGGTGFPRSSTAKPGEKPWICTWGGTLLEVFVYANEDSSGYQDYMSAKNSNTSNISTTSEDPLQTTVTAATAVTNAPSPTTTQVQWDLDGTNLPPAPYPRVVKIEERRIDDPPAAVPTCQQWEIREDGRRPALDEDDQEVIFEIEVSEPDPQLVDKEKIPPATAQLPEAEKVKRVVRVHPGMIEARSGGALYMDGGGLLRERETILIGKDLSACGCLWWTL